MLNHSESEQSDSFDDQDVIGVIKIKDGLFICDEFGANVSTHWVYVWSSIKLTYIWLCIIVI